MIFFRQVLQLCSKSRKEEKMEKIVLQLQRCKGCYNCIRACPKNAVSKAGVSNKKGYEVIQVDREKCIACAACYTVCPDYVFEVHKEENGE